MGHINVVEFRRERRNSALRSFAPGDVIVSGTPGGVGAKRQPPVWMKPGDVVEVDIPGVGLLRNPIGDEA